MNTNRITINKIQEMKVNGEPISMVTAYDYTSAKIINSTKITIILVGDSMGNNILGYDSTIPVTVEDIIKESISVAKLLHSKARRREVYKLLDYYSGTETSKYIECLIGNFLWEKTKCTPLVSHRCLSNFS